MTLRFAAVCALLLIGAVCCRTLDEPAPPGPFPPDGFGHALQGGTGGVVVPSIKVINVNGGGGQLTFDLTVTHTELGERTVSVEVVLPDGSSDSFDVPGVTRAGRTVTRTYPCTKDGDLSILVIDEHGAMSPPVITTVSCN